MEEKYNIYNINHLITELNLVDDKNENVIDFFNTFSFTSIVNHNNAKENSAYIFKNVIKEDSIKSKIIQLLNKLNQQNINKIITMIREIIFQTHDDILELVNQCIQKIKRDNNIIRPLVATLCYELLSTYFVTLNKEKIYFRKLFFTAIKENYVSSLDFNNSEWSKEKAEKVMILLGTCYNSKIIDNNIMTSIINDLKNKINFIEDGTLEYYESVEKSIYLLSYLISSIILDENTNIFSSDLVKYLEQTIELYKPHKYINKKSRLLCQNIIFDLLK